jgi:hypothetical protein
MTKMLMVDMSEVIRDVVALLVIAVAASIVFGGLGFTIGARWYQRNHPPAPIPSCDQTSRIGRLDPAEVVPLWIAKVPYPKEK